LLQESDRLGDNISRACSCYKDWVPSWGHDGGLGDRYLGFGVLLGIYFVADEVHDFASIQDALLAKGGGGCMEEEEGKALRRRRWE
jgi:hypothetical protein